MKNLSILLVAAALVWMAGCKSTTSPTTFGSFAGRVLLFDSTGTALPDFSGTSVVLDGTTFSTTTDSLGQWQINGVPEGQYNVTASKQGFGAFHWCEQAMVGGRIDLESAGIAHMSDHAPILSYAQFGGGILGFAALPNIDTAQSLAGYCDLDSTIQPSDSHLATTDYTLDGGFSYDQLRAAGARSGQTLYVSASNVYEGDRYTNGAFAYAFFDPAHNEYRWASTGPKSNVIAVTMP